MPCITVDIGGAVALVSVPLRGIVRRSVQRCETCKRRTRQVIRWGGAWYGDTRTCCACGDSWDGTERYPRPFRRGWRKDAVALAQERWRHAMSPAEYAARVQADIDEELAWIDEDSRAERTADAADRGEDQ